MRESIVEPYGGVAGILFWPLVFLLILVAWRLRANKTAAAVSALCAGAILTMGFIYIVVFGPTSLSVLHDFDAGLAVLGGVLLALFAGAGREFAAGKWRTAGARGLLAIAMGLIGLTMLIYGIAVPVEDLVLPRHVAQGAVTLLEIRGRRPVTYFVHIGSTRVQASAGLYHTLYVGQAVRAEVSRGSDFIRDLEWKAPHPQ